MLRKIVNRHTSKQSQLKAATIFGGIVLGIFAVAVAQASERNHWNPTVVEVIKLPKYCWGQFQKEYEEVPGYKVTACSVYANHVCPGLVALNRAATPSSDISRRRQYLEQADREFQYSITHIKREDCASVWPDIDASVARIRILRNTLLK